MPSSFVVKLQRCDVRLAVMELNADQLAALEAMVICYLADPHCCTGCCPEAVMPQADNLEHAIQIAALSDTVDATLHPHQRRIGRARLTCFKNRLMHPESVDAIRSAQCFGELYYAVAASKTKRIGDLAIYDVALRIGGYLGLAPEEVYLHAGAAVGAKNFGIRGRKARLEDFPEPLRRLTPTQAEDFLCGCKDRIAATVNAAR